MDRFGYDLSASYPHLDSRKPEARQFNRWIRHKVLRYVRQFRTRADAEQRNKRALQQLWGLELSYDVCYSNERFISLRLSRVLMETGNMHPINYYETINYDLRQGRQLRTLDIFKRGYLKSFSTYSRKYLREHYVITDEDSFNRGTKPNSDNFVDWNIVPDGVLLSFEDYQVGPHSFGQPEFVVPSASLHGVVRQDTLRKLLASNKLLK